MENDLPNAKMHNRRYWIGFAFSVVSLFLGITGMIIGVVFYHRLRITHSFDSHLAALGVLAILVTHLLLVGALGLVGYLLMIIKTGEKKTVPTLLSISGTVVALVIGTIGISVTRAQFEEYKTFTPEKWAAAAKDPDYRGLLVSSFLEQYDVKGCGSDEVSSLLGPANHINEFVLETDPPQYGGMEWIYDLGFYRDYMDASFLEITFSQTNVVLRCEVSAH